ncbi:MAG: CARDB domain-containing protein, partial [Methanosarcinales archaeon]
KCPCGETLTVKVCADCENKVHESDETNNCKEERVNCPTCKKPDLTVTTNVTFDEDGKAIVNYTVTNIGDETAGNSTTCLYVDSTELQAPSDSALKCEPNPTQNQFCPELAPDESYTGTFKPVKCPCGETLTVKVCADCKYEVEESNEDNNCERKRVECPECKKPDLVVTKNEVEGNNGKFVVYYTVTNKGTAKAEESKTSLLVNGVVKGTDSCPVLGPSDSYKGEFKLEECPCGETLNVTVCADYTDAVKESDETNNCLEDELECPPCGPTASYGKNVHSQRNVLYARGALGEPDDRGALMYRNAKIVITLEDSIPNCEKVSVWARRVAGQAPKFTVEISSDGKSWTEIGTETCNSFGWTQYDFNGNGQDVKYIRITKHGSSSRGWWQQLKLMGLDAVYAEGKPN